MSSLSVLEIAEIGLNENLTHLPSVIFAKITRRKKFSIYSTLDCHGHLFPFQRLQELWEIKKECSLGKGSPRCRPTYWDLDTTNWLTQLTQTFYTARAVQYLIMTVYSRTLELRYTTFHQCLWCFVVHVMCQFCVYVSVFTCTFVLFCSFTGISLSVTHIPVKSL